MRRSATLLLAGLLLAGTVAVPATAQAAPRPASADASRAASAGASREDSAGAPRPVVLVHGRNAGPGVWGSLTERLTTAGTPADRIFAWSYDSSRSTNEVLAGQLAAYVDDVLRRTGADRVDLVAHSLGSLPTRWYVKYGGGAPRVRNWVSLAGPNHGTGLAWACALWDQGCRDMTPGSYVVSRLNEGDETPGDVRYTTFRSAGDGQILPTSSTALSGARNVQVADMGHNDLLGDPGVAEQVLATLTAP
ncbi:lipase [Streptomyces omiyaensis]|uniref:esterase/lipase family protein n=1 Tax=Streptomyces omiyaensis TaxID=68247 RepID=UPI001675602A|nr:triacylglycerol lipase [Streptomyces omiyaensis]GGY80178.1 lipase [Streptomyces omiyaensis]